jgi:hypothetical protein
VLRIESERLRVGLCRPEWPAAEFLLKSVSDKLERCLAGERKVPPSLIYIYMHIYIYLCMCI